MLKPEAAREQLSKIQSRDVDRARRERVTSQPKAVATAALGILGRTVEGNTPKDWKDRNKLERQHTLALIKDAKLRAKVFAAWFPTLAKEIEAGWQILGRMPYQVNSTRRGYRAPDRPEMYGSIRQNYFERLVGTLSDIPDSTLTVEWVAAWSAHLGGWRSDDFGYLLAGAVDAGGKTADAVLQILQDSAANRHEIGGPGGHATRGLLCCSNPAAWQFMENLLLAAQRQEGLRQTILEAVDEAHPDAFVRMVNVVLKNNLIRFASVARAAGVWFGEEEMVENPKKLKADLEGCVEMLGSAAARQKALKSGDAVSTFRALWALGFLNIDEAYAAAVPILKAKEVGRRFAALKLLMECGLPGVVDVIAPLLNDPDDRIVAEVLRQIRFPDTLDWEEDDDEADEHATPPGPADMFERLEKILPKLPKEPKSLKEVVPGWFVNDLDREDAADALLNYLGKRPAERLLPYLSMMDDSSRVRALGELCKPRTLSSQVREMLLAVAGEPNHYVREAALKHLKNLKIAEDEVLTLEKYLTRKTPDFRRSVFELLLARTDKAMVGTIERLLAAGDANQRLAGIELSRRMVDKDRQAEPIRTRLRSFQESRGKRMTKAEAQAIEYILDPSSRPPTLDDGLGTFNPADRSEIVPPKKHEVLFASPAAVALIKSLDALIHENKDKTYTVTQDADDGGKSEEKVLGSVVYRWGFPGTYGRNTAEQDRARWPLRELWEQWWENRPDDTRDEDGLELIRAIRIGTERIREGEPDDDFDDDDDDDEDNKLIDPAVRAASEQIKPIRPVKVKYDGLIDQLLDWFMKMYPPTNAIDFLLDAAETAFAMVPASLNAKLPKANNGDASDDDDDDDDDDDRQQTVDWRNDYADVYDPFQDWFSLASGYRHNPEWTTEHSTRLFQLARWREEPVPGVRRVRVDIEIMVKGYAAGAATLADVYDHLIGPRDKERYGHEGFHGLRVLTGHASDYPEMTTFPMLQQAVDTVVEKIVASELARGESASVVSQAADSIAKLHGADILFRLLAGLGKTGFVKTSSYGGSQNKPAVLTSLIQKVHPTDTDTEEAFIAAVQAGVAAEQFTIDRVMELGLVNPRWLKHVAAAIEWPGFEEAVYWFIAHVNSRWSSELDEDEDDDDDTGDDVETADGKKPTSPWKTIVQARSNLTAEQRNDGVIDVAWFHQAYEAVGDNDRWDAIEAAAKFLGYGQSHKKAGRLADVLLGRTKKKELVDGIQKKNLKEYVKLLGLLPLPSDPAKRDADLADRYTVLKGYERYARGLSSLSKEPALQTARLGLENLAVTAGFPDPTRLEWAVTAKELADLAEKPAVVKLKGFEFTLSLTAEGTPELVTTQGGKAVKKVPGDVKKSPKVEELFERKKAITRTASNTKRTLEQAMCTGDTFRGSELKMLMTHPLVKPLITRLVLKTAAGMGYPVKGGAALKGHDGKTVSVKAADDWGIAHPLDFVASKDWDQWQRECFKAERLQPFKQVFREVYVLTAAEKEDHDRSRRYSGQQVNETQSKAMLASRGWSTRDEMTKLYRTANLVVELEFDHGYSTPADAAAPAVREVVFRKRGDWSKLPLEKVPAIVFSEVMRDVDLIVSVAHVGGVDPEATQSTIEMRTALLRETCTLLKLANVNFDSRHALVRGEYGQYSVHLGSGVVHKQPGGSLCVVAVNAQHRGRLFLPFADDDPRTAEVISKVMLLARDKEIQDPTILDQIRAK